MRWLRNSPVTGLSAGKDGGSSVGTGGRIRQDDFLMVLMAGFAWEFFDEIDDVDLPASKPDDLEQARAILAKTPHLRGVVKTSDGKWRPRDVEEGLLARFRQARDLLAPYAPLVDAIALRLENEGRLSGRSVAAIIREWDKKDRIAPPTR